MTLDYKLTRDDFLALARHDARRLAVSRGWLHVVVWIALFLSLAWFTRADLFGLFVILWLAYWAFYLFARWRSARFLRDYYSDYRLSGLTGDQHIELRADDLFERAPNREVRWRWERFSSITTTPAHVFVRPTPMNTVIIPVHAFTSDEHRKQLITFVEDRLAILNKA